MVRVVIMMLCWRPGALHACPFHFFWTYFRYYAPWSVILWGQVSLPVCLWLFLSAKSSLSPEERVLGVMRNYWCTKRPDTFLGAWSQIDEDHLLACSFFLGRMNMWSECLPLGHTSLTHWWFPGGYQGYSYLGKWSSGIYRILCR